MVAKDKKTDRSRALVIHGHKKQGKEDHWQGTF
jgi:hypothetical protein